MAKKRSTGSISNQEESEDREDGKEKKKELIVQYIIVRNDVYRNQERSFNQILQHTSSAAAAVIHKYYHHKNTRDYLKDLDGMRKKVFQVHDEKELFALENNLVSNEIDYKMWIKQPGNFATCIATRPYPISEISEHFKTVKLYKK